MLDCMARSHLHPPPAAFQPLDGPRASSFCNPGPYAAYNPPRRSSAVLSPRRNSYSAAQARDGLRTPPPDMLSTDYGVVQQSTSSGHLRQFEPPIQTSGIPKMLDSFRNSAPVHNRMPLRRNESPVHAEQSKGRSMSNGATMTIPPTINSTKGNLAEFASQITCLFWFESTSILQQVAEQPQHQPFSPSSSLASDAIPTSGFRKWVTTILSTTQVSQNVILLALLFIYRLKKSNPTVKGKPGSEFRLFTVALMLGNKFLDDNTYTNKTWAEVSGINVQEIHIMEVEFLSNMRYSLFVGEREWKDWHVKLGKFWAFWDRASRSPIELPTRQLVANSSGFSSAIPQLPSPPASTSSSPPYPNAHSPATSSATNIPANSSSVYTPASSITHTPASSSGYSPYPPAPMHPHLLNPPHLPYTPTLQPDFESLSKKRLPEYAPELQPPAKRASRFAPTNLTVQVPSFPVHLPPSSTSNTPIPRIQPVEPYALGVQQRSPASAFPPGQQQGQLPLPGTRSMSMVFTQGPPQAISAGPIASVSPYGSRQTSPYSQGQSIHHSATSSPTTPNYASQSSPTWILGPRDSPYRPVRTFNTLLVPPPSNTADAQQLEAQSLGYHTLAKSRPQYKTGLVPYMHPETSWTQSWPEPTPLYRF